MIDTTETDETTASLINRMNEVFDKSINSVSETFDLCL